jgi:hypothetical protein
MEREGRSEKERESGTLEGGERTEIEEEKRDSEFLLFPHHDEGYIL